MAKSFFTGRSGALFVTPGGQSEQGPQIYNAGFRWCAVNVADGDLWEQWLGSVKSWGPAGLRIPVWGRVQNSSVAAITAVAIARNRPCILNIEDEFKTRSPADFEREIRSIRAAHPRWTKGLIINTTGWLFNDVDYRPIAHRPVQLQVMVTDMHLDPADLQRVTNDCIVHAREKGFTDIGVTFQANDSGGNIAKPEWYAFWKGRARNYFTGDWIGGQSAWRQWAVA